MTKSFERRASNIRDCVANQLHFPIDDLPFVRITNADEARAFAVRILNPLTQCRTGRPASKNAVDPANTLPIQFLDKPKEKRYPADRATMAGAEIAEAVCADLDSPE